ncbi:hypothetical protein GCM10020000_13550 [Streptomyces olivoverticillatus]
MIARLRTEPAAVRRETMFAFVLGAVAEILEYEPDRLDPRSGFFQLGMNSAMATQVRARLEAGLEHRLPAPVIFEYPTVEALADYLLTLVHPANDPAPYSGRSPESKTLDRTRSLAETASDADIENMPEEELIAFLAEEIGAPLAGQEGRDDQQER